MCFQEPGHAARHFTIMAPSDGELYQNKYIAMLTFPQSLSVKAHGGSQELASTTNGPSNPCCRYVTYCHRFYQCIVLSGAPSVAPCTPQCPRTPQHLPTQGQEQSIRHRWLCIRHYQRSRSLGCGHRHNCCSDALELTHIQGPVPASNYASAVSASRLDTSAP